MEKGISFVLLLDDVLNSYDIKRVLLIIIFFVTAVDSNSQGNNLINAGKLVEITEKGDFASLSKLVSSLNYLVLDSSMSNDGTLFYFTKEPELQGNTLSCNTDDKMKIKLLTFITFREMSYNDLKSQFKKLGFKSQGVHKGNSAEIIESEDFEKGKIIAATAIRKNDDESFVYEFTLLKW